MVALCAVHPDDFDDVRARYPSFDWGSADRYVRALERRLDEHFQADRPVEVALLDVAAFEEWCEIHGRRPNSSVSRADWAADPQTLRIAYAGDLDDLLMYDTLLGCSQNGLDEAEPWVATELTTALPRLLDELGSCATSGRGRLDLRVYDHRQDEDRTPYTWSFVVEWRGDLDGRTIMAPLRESEHDIVIALLGMGLVNDGVVDLELLETHELPVHAFAQPSAWRWLLGPDHPGLMARVPGPRD